MLIVRAGNAGNPASDALGSLPVGGKPGGPIGVAVGVAVAVEVDVAVGVAVAVEVDVAVGVAVAVEVDVAVGVAVAVEVDVAVGVGVRSAHGDRLIVLVSNVTAPLRAYRLPLDIAPVVRVMEVSARMFPLKLVVVPMVAELPTCQKILHA